MKWEIWCVVGLVVASLGCGGRVENETTGSPGWTASGTEYLLTTQPADAIAVGAARQSVVDQQEVTLVGVIGGSASPFVEGMAAFTIVDSKVPFCAPEEGCKTPWDYCCTQNEVKDNIATVKVVDASGNPMTIDAKGLLGVKELSTVWVQGKVKRDDAGNLSIAASKVFVKNP